MTLPLTNKTALVTGGSRSIGAAIVKKLRMMGAAVAFTYAGWVEKANELVRTIESTGGRALIQADKCRPRRGQECRRRDVKQFRRTGHSR